MQYNMYKKLISDFYSTLGNEFLMKYVKINNSHRPLLFSKKKPIDI